MSITAPGQKPAAVLSQYDEPDVDYLSYWTARGYEHRAEVMALSRLLQGRRFGHAVDVGGGYGRLSAVLRDYADRVTLADPSYRQLEVAERYLDQDPAIDTQLTDAAHLDFATASVDLAVMVRVLHHLPDPVRELSEIADSQARRLRHHRGGQRQARGQPGPLLAQRREDSDDAGRHPV